MGKLSSGRTPPFFDLASKNPNPNFYLDYNPNGNGQNQSYPQALILRSNCAQTASKCNKPLFLEVSNLSALFYAHFAHNLSAFGTPAPKLRSNALICAQI